MNRKLLLVPLALFLSACATHSAKDALPASDLDVLLLNVAKTTKVTLLPNGKEFCAELAADEDAQDDCLGDLEDALYAANRDGERTLLTVQRFVARERLRRNPCAWWERVLRRSRCDAP